VNLKILVLGAGLAVMGMTGSAWADSPACKNIQQTSDKIRDGGTYCLSKDYPYTSNGKCKCPNPNYNSNKTQKCRLYNSRTMAPSYVYHCENP
jgi:hypothetical protein